jgi:hypothetical protein
LVVLAPVWIGALLAAFCARAVLVVVVDVVRSR